MSVRAKFKVQSVTESEGGLKTANLSPVTSGSPENEKFFKWTPGGQIQLGTINPNAAREFVPGRAFYVDFTSEEEAAVTPDENVPRIFAIIQRMSGDVDAKVYYAYTNSEARQRKAEAEEKHGVEFQVFANVRVPEPQSTN